MVGWAKSLRLVAVGMLALCAIAGPVRAVEPAEKGLAPGRSVPVVRTPSNDVLDAWVPASQLLVDPVCTPSTTPGVGEICLPGAEPPPGVSDECDNQGIAGWHAVAVYSYPEFQVNRWSTVSGLIQGEIQWMNDEYDKAAGPSRDQDIRWLRVNGSIPVYSVAVPDPEHDNQVSWPEVRSAVANAGCSRSDRGYVVWHDGFLDCGACADDTNPYTFPSYAMQTAPNGTVRSGSLHEFTHIIGAPHTSEYADVMYDYSGNASTNLCGEPGAGVNGVTIDCNKNEFYSTHCNNAPGGYCWLSGYNIATNVLLDPPRTVAYVAECSNLAATFGDEDPDQASLGGGNDVFQAWEGNDVVDSNGGDDTLCGHWGTDTLRGGAHNDLLIGGWGPDTIRGQYGDDSIHGADGDDALYDGFGLDRIEGGNGHDTLYQCADQTNDVILDSVESVVSASSSYC